MRKTRFFAGLLALLLLVLPLAACSDEPPVTDPGSEGGQTTPPPSGGGESDGGDEEESVPNQDPDYDPAKDPDYFLSSNGYPMGFAVTFTVDGVGFDTASNSLPNGSNTVSYTFTKEDFVDLYRTLDNCNFWSIPLDLTYSKLTGSTAPDGPGAQYVITVTTTEKGTCTCRTDAAAIARLTSDPNVSNIGSLVSELSGCLEMYLERVGA